MSKRRTKDQNLLPSVRTKSVWFRILAVAAPFLLLALLEIALRLGGFGYSPAFFKPARIEGQKYWVGNLDFGRRFFPKALVRAPGSFAFPDEKPANTKRIFVLGESAALGEPQPAFGFSRMLDRLLTSAFPSNHFEVINVAMTAINSHVILPIARDCAQRDGDLWVIYMGNNEAVGPFGAGTVFSAQTPPLAAIRANLFLKRARVGQFVDALVQRARGSSKEQQYWKGMEMMAHQRVPSFDPRMTNLYANFERNLNDILDTAHDAHVPVVLCTVAVNQRDCPPFASVHRPALSINDLAASEKSYAVGIASQGEKSLAALLECERLDPTYAELQFRIASRLSELNRPKEAREHFQRAVNEDALRFRADGVLNEIIRHVGSRAHLVDAAQSLPLSDESFYEHVHFNLPGNYQLARMVADEAAKALDLKNGSNFLSGAECEFAIGYTDWNIAQALRLMIDRMSLPPFIGTLEQSNRVARMRSDLDGIQARFNPENYKTQAEKILKAVARYPNDWELRKNAGVLLSLAKEFPRAEEQLREAMRLMPYAADPYFGLAGVMAFQGKSAEAAQLFEKCLQFDPGSFDALIRLAIVEMDQRKFTEAIGHLEKALRANPDSVTARLRLGSAWLQLKDRAKARAQLEEVLRIDPKNSEARELLQRAGGAI